MSRGNNERADLKKKKKCPPFVFSATSCAAVPRGRCLGYPMEHGVGTMRLHVGKPTSIDPSYSYRFHSFPFHAFKPRIKYTNYKVNTPIVFMFHTGCFIEAISKQCGTARHWSTMGRYSQPFSRQKRCPVSAKMGEGREPGASEGSVDEGGG